MAALEGITVATRRDARRRGLCVRRASASPAPIGERTRAIVICSPVQSDGTRDLGGEAARSLVRALERRGGEPVWLIHDEIYREQIFVDDAGRLGASSTRNTIVDELAEQEQRADGLAPRMDSRAERVHRAGDQGACLGDLVRRHVRAARRAAGLSIDRQRCRSTPQWYREHRTRLLDGFEDQRPAIRRAGGRRFMSACGCPMAFVARCRATTSSNVTTSLRFRASLSATRWRAGCAAVGSHRPSSYAKASRGSPNTARSSPSPSPSPIKV